MIKLNTVFPSDIVKEMTDISKVQQQLVNLTKDKFANALKMINALPYADDVSYVLELILTAAEARVQNLEIYAEFTAYVSNSSEDFSMIKAEIFRQFFPERVKYYYFLKYVQLCVTQGYISDDEIAYAVDNFKSDYPNEVIPTAYLFYYFAPFLQSCNNQLYDELYKTYQKSASRFGVFHEIQDFIPRLPKLSANNWDLYWKEMEVGYPSNSLESVIKTDDVKTLQDRAQNDRAFDYNQEIKLHSYESSVIPESTATLIQFASYYGSMKCFRFLLKNADVNYSKSQDFSSECFAIAGGHPEVVDSYIRRRSGFDGGLRTVVGCHRYELFDQIYSKNKDKTAFHAAAASDNITAMIYFLEHGIDVNMIAPNDNEDIVETPLHFAAKFGRANAARFLLAHKKIDPNIGEGLRTALHYASAKGFSEVVEYILNLKNVHVNALSGANRTSLQDAAHFGHLRCVQKLLEANGIEVNGDIPTPIQEAVSNGFSQVSTILLETPNVDLNVIDDDENSLLHLAASSGKAEIVEDLLSNKSVRRQLKCVNRYQQTPFAVAAENPLSDCVAAFIKCGGSDPNARDLNGNTPLHLAAKNGSWKSVKLILEMPNVNINETNNEGVSILIFIKLHFI